MQKVKSLLKRVWSLFDEVGVSDDFAIIEHIAAVLLDMIDAPKPPDGLEIKKRRLPPKIMAALPDLLRSAAEEAGGISRLFDHHVLFHLTSMLAGKRYPTPRHIVRTMARLADVRPEHDVADLACGSGGFLVERLDGGDPKGSTTGIDISLEWARLAWANLALHGEPRAQVVPENALSALSDSGCCNGLKYDRILMNPPFGVIQSEDLVGQALGIARGNRSEVALTLLALRRLRDAGRAAVLVPSGVLYRTDGDELTLRRELVDDWTLQAIISWPKDAFQPFSQTQTHTLLAERCPPTLEHRVWLFHLQDDGYRSGRGRDLTEPPREPNDLQLIEQAMDGQGLEWLLPAGDRPLIRVRRLATGSAFLGTVFEGINGGGVWSIDINHRLPARPLEVLAIRQEDNQQIRLRIPPDGGDPIPLDEPKIAKKEAPITNLYRGGEREQAAVVSADGRLIGQTVSRSALSGGSYDLRPERYLQSLPAAVAGESAALLLSTIRRSQRELLDRLDLVMSRLGQPVLLQGLNTDRLWDDGVDGLAILDKLAPDQRRTWEAVKTMTTSIPQESGSGLTASPFGPSDVGDSQRLTLDLLERMGLVVQTSIADAPSVEPKTYYRRVTERDRWRPEPANDFDQGGSR